MNVKHNVSFMVAPVYNFEIRYWALNFNKA